MTWQRAKALLQLEAEERIGFIMRERARIARELEDRAFAAALGGKAPD